MTAPISVFILTFNEEANIGRCLSSLSGFTDDIVIIDSYSTDRTLAIAKNYGCRIYQNPFANHANQSNWALTNITFKHPWLMRLDSDEVLPNKLKSELANLVAHAGANVMGIYLNRRMYFMNRWLRHGGLYPHYILRVWKQGAGHYEDRTEEHFVLKDGTALFARNDFLEDNRQNSLKYWLRKHDDLSDGEIGDTLQPSIRTVTDLTPSLFGSKVERTRWLKTHVYCKMPLFLRALLYFIYRYFVRLGFLDGVPGLIFHVMQGFWYRFYVDARIYEMQSGWQQKLNDHSNM